MKLKNILNKEKIKYFLNENKWIIAALLFFIVWKFILIAILWSNRLSPPEPDDSYSYINQIITIKECPRVFCNYPSVTYVNSSGFIYLSYRVFLGMIAKLINLSSVQAYRFGFYLGTVLISLTFLFFLKKITNKKEIIAFSLFFLAFYHGIGETHGFYWVVPSFYSTLLFFLILALILSPKRNYLILLFLTPVFVFTHPLSIYFSFILPIFYIFLVIFRKKSNFLILKKTALVFLVALICHTSLSFYLKKRGSENNNYFSIGSQIERIRIKLFSKKITSEKLEQGFETNRKLSEKPLDNKSILKENISILLNEETQGKGNILDRKMRILSDTYFKWFFPHWIGLLPLILFLLILFYYRQHILLSLYFSSLIFFIISTFATEYGYRSGLILWIASFLLYGFGFFYSFCFIQGKIRKKYLLLSGQIILSLGLLMFVLLNVTYSIIYARNLSIRNNYDINPEFLDYLITHTRENDLIKITPILFYYNATSPLFSRDQITQDTDSSKYMILLEANNDEEKINNSRIYVFFKKIMNFLKIQKKERMPKENKTPENFSEEKRFGSVIIYKNNLWDMKNQ